MAETIELANGFALRLGEEYSAEAAAQGKALYEKFKADDAAQAILAKAQSVEDAYDALHSYVDCTLDEFRDFFERVAHRAYDLAMEAAGPKEELTEEELDVVAGGGLWSWIKRNISSVCTIVVGAAITVAGAASVAAGVVAGLSGFGAPAAVGGFVGGSALISLGVGTIAAGVNDIK